LTRFKFKPSFDDALFIAGYYSGIGENIKAVEYYRKSLELGKGNGFDYSYKIFENIANAVWKDELSFNEVIPAADAVLGMAKKNNKNIVDVARLMTRLADKTGNLYYMFAKWCLIRKINLGEAEMFARKTLPQVQPGRFVHGHIVHWRKFLKPTIKLTRL